MAEQGKFRSRSLAGFCLLNQGQDVFYRQKTDPDGPQPCFQDLVIHIQNDICRVEARRVGIAIKVDFAVPVIGCQDFRL